MAKRTDAAIPRDFLARDLREKRKLRLLARKLTAFVSFVTVYVLVLVMDRNISGRAAVQHILEIEILDTSHAASGITFDGINSVGSFWDWFANSLLAVAYATTTSDGLPRSSEELYTLAAHTHIVGGFHLLQTRYKVVNSSDTESVWERCHSDWAPTLDTVCFSTTAQSTASFGQSNGTNASVQELATLEMFHYNASAGGFETYFLRSSTNGAAESKLVDQMRAYRWLDRQTRSVEITMPLYNLNLKLWSIVYLTVDFDLAGAVTPSSYIHVANIEPYDFNSRKNVVRSILEGVYVLHVVYFTLQEFWDFCVLSNGSIKLYMARYGVLNNLGDWANVFINSAIMIWRYVTQTDSTRLKMMALTTLDDYVSASQLTEYDDILLALNICNLLLLTARALKYFQITNGGRRLMQSVYAAMPEITSFLPIYLSAIVGYSFIGHLLYGLKFPEWSSLSRASFRVFELNFGLYDPGPIYDAGGYMSVLFIYSANIVFCILMLNVFMAIVMSTWDKLVERETEKTAERSEFSHPMRPTDFLYLLWSDEDTIDTLIEIMQQTKENDITKAFLEHEWKHTGLSESPKVWETIIAWYWRDDVEEGPTTAAIDPLATTGTSDRTLILKSPRPHTPIDLWKRSAKVSADG